MRKPAPGYRFASSVPRCTAPQPCRPGRRAVIVGAGYVAVLGIGMESLGRRMFHRTSIRQGRHLCGHAWGRSRWVRYFGSSLGQSSVLPSRVKFTGKLKCGPWQPFAPNRKIITWARRLVSNLREQATRKALMNAASYGVAGLRSFQSAGANYATAARSSADANSRDTVGYCSVAQRCGFD